MKSINQKNIEKFNVRNEKRLSRISKAYDNGIKKTYAKWMPVSDTKRSFFVWRGRLSKSPKEAEIAKILNGENLRYYREVSFDNRKRFDFYIPVIDLVIEYDGRQHFTEFKEINNDITKELLLQSLGIKYIRYNKTHNLKTQIQFDLVNHQILK